MTTFQDYVDMARASGAREERSKQRRKVTMTGKVLSLLRANGEWLAVMQASKSAPGEVVISRLVPVAELKGSARRKADRWVEYLR